MPWHNLIKIQLFQEWESGDRRDEIGSGLP